MLRYRKSNHEIIQPLGERNVEKQHIMPWREWRAVAGLTCGDGAVEKHEQ